MAKRTLTCTPMRKRSSVRASYDYNISNDKKRKELIIDAIDNSRLSSKDASNLLSNIISYVEGDIDTYNDIIEFASQYITSDDLFDAWQQMREDKGMRTYYSWDEYVDEVEGN